MQMNDELRWYLLTSKKFERQIADAFTLFRKEGIEPLLIKGWAAARYYPADKPRFFGDVDIDSLGIRTIIFSVMPSNCYSSLDDERFNLVSRARSCPTFYK